MCVCVFADQIQFRLKVYSELYDFQQCNSEYLCSGWSTKLNANNYKQNAVFCCCAVHFTIRFNLSKLWWPSLSSTKKNTTLFSFRMCGVSLLSVCFTIVGCTDDFMHCHLILSIMFTVHGCHICRLSDLCFNISAFTSDLFFFVSLAFCLLLFA